MQQANINLRFDVDGCTLLAEFQKTDSAIEAIDDVVISKKLKSEGYDKLFIFKEGIKELVQGFNNPEISEASIKIASKRDGKVSIILSRDKMSAYLTITRAYGGKPVTLDRVKEVIKAKKIRNGFMPEVIKDALKKGEAEEVCIAKGKPVINGSDAKFVCLLPQVKVRTPQVTENGNVDYRDLGEILIVHPGDVLMRREPATQGRPSKNVLGEVIRQKPGNDTKFAKGLIGVQTLRDDPNTLVATETGQPIITDNGVNVENAIELPVVNLKSGNIIFDGSVTVSGDIENGMKVEATGDVHVLGMVQGATIEAGGDVVVKGAIIGHGDVKQGQSEQINSIVNAKGSVSAKFVENVIISSGDSIYIKDWSIKSELNALNEIIVGKRNAKKGLISGGKIKSGILVKAKNIGSSAGVATYIQVGSETNVEKEFESTTADISNHMQKLQQLHKMMAQLKNNPTKQAEEALKKSKASKQKLESELKILRVKKGRLETDQKRVENAKVVVENAIFASTTINLCSFKKEIKEDLGARTFTLQEKEVVQILT